MKIEPTHLCWKVPCRPWRIKPTRLSEQRCYKVMADRRAAKAKLRFSEYDLRPAVCS
jgi:hypothetical protein